jgi:hypothetical protein
MLWDTVLPLLCCQVREANPTLDANLVNTLMRTFASLTPHFMVCGSAASCLPAIWWNMHRVLWCEFPLTLLL